MTLHAVQYMRALYFAKNDKIKLQVKYEGVVGTSGQNNGGPSIRSKLECKGKSVIDKKVLVLGLCRFPDLEEWVHPC